MYKIEFDSALAQELKKIPKVYHKPICMWIKKLSTNPKSGLKLQGRERLYRLRQGPYRIIYAGYEDRLIVYIERIDHRKQVYKEK